MIDPRRLHDDGNLFLRILRHSLKNRVEILCGVSEELRTDDGLHSVSDSEGHVDVLHQTVA